MKKQLALFLTLFLLMPVLSHAQTGCIDSPENPTALLGLVGSAAGALCYLRARIKNRR